MLIGKAEGPEYQGLNSRNSWAAAVGMTGFHPSTFRFQGESNVQTEAKNNDFIVKSHQVCAQWEGQYFIQQNCGLIT